MWSKINNRNYVANTLNNAREPQETAPAQPAQSARSHASLESEIPPPNTAANLDELRIRAQQHVAHQESQGRLRTSQAETSPGRPGPRGADSQQNTLTALPESNETADEILGNHQPYAQDKTLISRLVDGAQAGGSSTSTATVYKTKLNRFSAWLRERDLPDMQSRLFAPELTHLAVAYSAEANESVIMAALQHLREMESSRFGTVQIPRVPRHGAGNIPEEDHWLISQVFKEGKSNSISYYKTALRAFSAWLHKQNTTLCETLPSKQLADNIAAFLKENPCYEEKMMPAIRHLQTFDSGGNVVVKQNRATHTIPEDDKTLMRQFHDVEYQRLEENARKEGRTIRLHKHGKFVTAKRTAADKYVSVMNAFSAWRQEQKMPGSLASRLHDPMLDIERDLFTKNMSKAYAGSVKGILKRLQAAFPPGSSHAAGENPTPSFALPGSTWSGWNWDPNTPHREVTGPFRSEQANADPVPRRLLSSDNLSGTNSQQFSPSTIRQGISATSREEQPESDSIYRGLSSLNALSGMGSREFDPPTPQSHYRAPFPQHAIGHASGQGLNCLLDSILQVYHGVRSMPGINTVESQWFQHEAQRLREHILTPSGIAPLHGEIDIYGGAGQLLADSLGVRLQVIQQTPAGEFISHPPLGHNGPLINLLHTPGHFQPLWP